MWINSLDKSENFELKYQDNQSLGLELYYFSDINKFDLIDAKEEIRLWQIVQLCIKEENNILSKLINWSIKLSWDKESIKLLSNIQLLIKREYKTWKKIRETSNEKVKLLKNIRKRKAHLVMDEKEKNIFYKILEEGELATNEFMNANFRLVREIALKYKNKIWWLQLLDLIQEWNIWLLYSVKNFDPTRWNSFYTYAKNNVKKSIVMYIQNQLFIRIHNGHIHNVFNLLKETVRLSHKLLREPTIEELSVWFGKTIEETKKLIRINSIAFGKSIYSLSHPVLDSEKTTFWDLVRDTNLLDLEEQVYQKMLKEKLNEIMDWFSQREKEIIDRVFWLNGKKEESYRKIWKKISISHERVSQIKKNIIEKIRIICEEREIWVDDF